MGRLAWLRATKHQLVHGSRHRQAGGSLAQLKDMSSPCDGLRVKCRAQGQDRVQSGNSDLFGCLAIVAEFWLPLPTGH